MNVYEGLNAYKTYLAIRNHFNTDYDYFKYNGKLKVSNDSFLKRRDKFFFAKIERKYRNEELVYFFVSNFLDDGSSWSGSLVGSECEKRYTDWRKRIESLKYLFRTECESILNELDKREAKFDSFFVSEDGSHPDLLKWYLGKRVTLETFTIMDKVLKFTKQWNQSLKDDIIYREVRVKSNKYDPFLQVDLSTYKKIMKDVFMN